LRGAQLIENPELNLWSALWSSHQYRIVEIYRNDYLLWSVIVPGTDEVEALERVSGEWAGPLEPPLAALSRMGIRLPS
jgi:hypothetical protein